MIVITVELRSARTGKRQLLGAAVIANDGTETAESGGVRGSYLANFSGKGGRPWKDAKVVGFPRRRLLVWDLIYRALRDAVGSRNP